LFFLRRIKHLSLLCEFGVDLLTETIVFIAQNAKRRNHCFYCVERKTPKPLFLLRRIICFGRFRHSCLWVSPGGCPLAGCPLAGVPWQCVPQRVSPGGLWFGRLVFFTRATLTKPGGVPWRVSPGGRPLEGVPWRAPVEAWRVVPCRVSLGRVSPQGCPWGL
jgi:hypothetical protein